eukprot:scaffold32229_cov25-Phaeocystis_antarctica.AAC.2
MREGLRGEGELRHGATADDGGEVGLGLEGHPAAEKHVSHHAHRPHVGGAAVAVGGGAAQHQNPLRRHVAYGAARRACALGADAPCKTEVGELERAVRVEQLVRVR